jgi:hypothetical protein
VLTSDDHLYRGQGEPFVGHHGKLTVVMITDTSRFDRPSYLEAKKIAPETNSGVFWMKIPGAKL